jgi:hypothetical protein
MSSRVCDALNRINAAHAVSRLNDAQTDVMYRVYGEGRPHSICVVHEGGLGTLVDKPSASG